jgi:hypothetical protein
MNNDWFNSVVHGNAFEGHAARRRTWACTLWLRRAWRWLLRGVR